MEAGYNALAVLKIRGPEFLSSALALLDFRFLMGLSVSSTDGLAGLGMDEGLRVQERPVVMQGSLKCFYHL